MNFYFAFTANATDDGQIGKFFTGFTISRLISTLSLYKNFTSWCESNTTDFGKASYLCIFRMCISVGFRFDLIMSYVMAL